jgi:hypothetical protein
MHVASHMRIPPHPIHGKSSKLHPMKKSAFIAFAAATLGVPAANAATTVDFDPTGELAAQFPSGGAYTENATGGLNSSIGVNLANLAVDTLSGSQAESLAANGFANGASFTVGMFFNLSGFGSSTPGTQNTPPRSHQCRR